MTGTFIDSPETVIEGEVSIIYEVSLYGQQQGLFTNSRDATIAAEKLREAEGLTGDDRKCVIIEQKELLLG